VWGSVNCAAHGETEGGGRGEWRGGAPVSERARGLAGQLREDAVELKAGLV
jgi:hypothetical protein